jgi:hypothetical protein
MGEKGPRRRRHVRRCQRATTQSHYLARSGSAGSGPPQELVLSHAAMSAAATVKQTDPLSGPWRFCGKRTTSAMSSHPCSPTPAPARGNKDSNNKKLSCVGLRAVNKKKNYLLCDLSLIPSADLFINYRENAQELTCHTRLPVGFYRITGSFLQVSKLLL